MLDFKDSDQFRAVIQKNSGTPIFHAVLGSGFGQALDQSVSSDWKKVSEIPFSEFRSLKIPSAPDHQGKYVFYQKKEALISFQLGRLHGYEGASAQEVVSTVQIPRLAGVHRFILTNASGGLNPKFEPGDVMVLSDHVNLTGQNPLVGANPVDAQKKPLGPRFPSLEHLYSKDLSKKITALLEKENLVTHQGVYLGLLGPSFETPAEIKLFQRWGMDAVGMSTVWEAIALGHSGATVCGLSLVSNMGCGLVSQVLDHQTILDVSRASAQKIVNALFKLGDSFV